MKKLVSFLSLFVMSTAFAQNNTYQYHVDLNNVVEDKIQISLTTPTIAKNEIEFHIPKIVPGTYSVYDFGRFISDFEAFDSKGKQLDVEILDLNRWKIFNASELDKISYWVDDTWDVPIKNKNIPLDSSGKMENVVFEPGGSNIEADSNFTLNTFCLFGYLNEMSNLPFELKIHHPKGFYGSTSLKNSSSSASTDTFTADGYVNLADAPIMYCIPDTTNLVIGGADVLVSVYSPNGKIKSEQVAENLNELLKAQEQYLGGKLPVDRYAFLIHLSDKNGLSGHMGALEHSYSSLYYLPEYDIETIGQTIRDVSAHEFFHIVTPLNIHSKEIHNFDFINPKLSKHLWLYEGVTEYSASHVQVKYDLMSLEEYLSEIQSKIIGAESFNDSLPFTTMSVEAHTVHKDEYGNVYEKGALIAMCLDILLIKESDGKQNLQLLIRKLAEVYGSEVPFNDDELFSKIEELSSPKIKDFLIKHVAGSTPLPYKELLADAGISYTEEKFEMKNSLGGIGIDYNPETDEFFVKSISSLNNLGKKIGYRQGDVLYSLNGQRITKESIRKVIGDFFSTINEGDKMTVVLKRQKKDKYKLKKRKLRYLRSQVKVKHILSPEESLTSAQQKIQKAWLTPILD